MRVWVPVVVVLACLAPARSAGADSTPSDQQKMAIEAKPSVVRIVTEFTLHAEVSGQPLDWGVTSSGTGWFVTPDGYIATNAHVVDGGPGFDDARAKEDLTAELTVEARKQIGSRAFVKVITLERKGYIVLPNGDHLSYEGKVIGVPNSGKDCAIIKVKIENAPALTIGDSTKSVIQDSIVVIGFPGAVDKHVGGAALDDRSLLESTVTDGKIESLKRTRDGEQILQISAPITHGNSGGPAIDQTGTVIGLATFGAADPNNHEIVQGFNFLVASSTLVEFMKQAKVENTTGETNRYWHEGLEHYWATEYTQAITSFEEVVTLFPPHAEAAAFIIQSHQAQKDGKEKKPGTSGGAIAAAVILSLLGLGGIGYAIYALTRKKPGAPGTAASASASASVPMQQQGYAQPGYAQPGYAQPGYPPPSYPPPQPQAIGGYQQPQAQPQYPPQGSAPNYAAFNQPPQPQGSQMYGRVSAQTPAASAPVVARTVAVSAGGSAPIVPVQATVFAQATIGSLTCVAGPQRGQRFALVPDGILIGRQPGVAQIIVDDHRASAKHVWVGLEQGRLVCIDQSTTNGTFVNAVERGRVSKAELRDGDVLIVVAPDVLSLQIQLTPR